MPGVIFWSDKCQEDKCLDAFFGRTNARRTNAWTHFLVGQMPGGQMPGGNFLSDKCQEDKYLDAFFWSDKCLESFFGRTNARRTNAWSHFLVGQMPGVTFWSDKCQEDKCLDYILFRTNARRTNA